MIRVCDSIMGSGKTESAISYMNDHADQKFIFITPYLNEAARIKKGCPDLHFIEPSKRLSEYHFSKSQHTAALIADGRNVATTHQAFRGYTRDMLDIIRDKGYTLIVDENVEILEQFPIHADDVKLALDAGYIKENNGTFTLGNTEYKGKALKDLVSMMRSRALVRIDDGDTKFFYWALPPELITSFRDVFVLTYLFEGQSLHHLFEIYHIPYSYIGINKEADGRFRFGALPGYTPEYVHHLRDMLHILDNEKLNSVGDEYYALSKSWFERGGEPINQLKKNVYNCFRNVWCDIPAERRLWGTYNGAFNKVRGKGYTKKFLTFNAKATNAYRDRDALVYIANVFMPANERRFYRMYGVDADQDIYALSVMVQWIWRSAIRDGKSVQLYIPSKRMRTILENWMDSFDKEEI